MSPKEPIAFLFPGQGSQAVGMGKEISSHFQIARAIFDQASSILGFDVAELCFEGPAEKLQQTRFTQPAIVTTSLAIYAVLQDWGMVPTVLAGHSLGEYAALHVAQAITLSDTIRLIARRGELMEEAGKARPGAMSAILGAPREVVEEACRSVAAKGIVGIANYNSPEQMVIAGEKELVEEAGRLCKEKGAKRVVPLAVSGAFHTALMNHAADEMKNVVQSIAFSDPATPVVANVTATPYANADEIRRLLPQQIISPVRFDDSIRSIFQSGTRTFVEVGPGSVLTGLVKRIVPEARSYSVQDAKTLREILATLSSKSSSNATVGESA